MLLLLKVNVCTGSCSIWPHLQVSALRLEPVVDETLRVSSEAQHELPLSLQLVYSFNGLMDLREQANM